MANYTIISAWLDGETIRYTLNNNSIRPAYYGRNIENVSNTATTISFAQGEFIKVMSLDPIGGGVSAPRTVGQRKVQRRQTDTSSFEEQHDKRRMRTERNQPSSNKNYYASKRGEDGPTANIAVWLVRRWLISLKNFIKGGWNDTGIVDMFFLLLPFIPFIILYYILSGGSGSVPSVDSASNKFSSGNGSAVQVSAAGKTSDNESQALAGHSSAEQGQIKGTNVNMREYPSLSAQVVFRFPGREYVTIHEVTEPEQGKYPWYKVSYKNKTGWVYGEFIKR